MIAHPARFAVVRGVFEMLAEVEWPFLAEHRSRPAVRLGPWLPGDSGDLVCITGRVTGQVDWSALSPPSREETAAVEVVVTTVTPGFDGERTWQRLEELVSVVESAFRDTVTGKPKLSQAMLDAGVMWLQVQPVETSIEPMSAAGAVPLVGVHVLNVAYRARG